MKRGGHGQRSGMWGQEEAPCGPERVGFLQRQRKHRPCRLSCPRARTPDPPQMQDEEETPKPDSGRRRDWEPGLQHVGCPSRPPPGGTLGARGGQVPAPRPSGHLPPTPSAASLLTRFSAPRCPGRREVSPQTLALLFLNHCLVCRRPGRVRMMSLKQQVKNKHKIPIFYSLHREAAFLPPSNSAFKAISCRSAFLSCSLGDGEVGVWRPPVTWGLWLPAHSGRPDEGTLQTDCVGSKPGSVLGAVWPGVRTLASRSLMLVAPERWGGIAGVWLLGRLIRVSFREHP